MSESAGVDGAISTSYEEIMAWDGAQKVKSKSKNEVKIRSVAGLYTAKMSKRAAENNKSNGPNDRFEIK